MSYVRAKHLKMSEEIASLFFSIKSARKQTHGLPLTVQAESSEALTLAAFTNLSHGQVEAIDSGAGSRGTG